MHARVCERTNLLHGGVVLRYRLTELWGKEGHCNTDDCHFHGFILSHAIFTDSGLRATLRFPFMFLNLGFK
jgi:hypothetical protein